MKIIEFYRGERGNQNGDTLEQIMQFTLGQMEADHDYIQWLLPSNEQSQMNAEAPTLTEKEAQIFQSDKELQLKLKLSFIKFLDFLGLELVENQDKVVIQEMQATEKRPNPQWWMHKFNHNMLRVTRALKSMRLTGYYQYANALFEFLAKYKNKFSINTFANWQDAARGDISFH